MVLREYLIIFHLIDYGLEGETITIGGSLNLNLS